MVQQSFWPFLLTSSTKKFRRCESRLRIFFRFAALISITSVALAGLTSCGTGTDGTSTTPPAAPTVAISASPTTIDQGSSSTLTVSATNATKVVISNATDSTTFTLAGTGGTQAVTPATTTTYTATATGAGGTATAQTTITVTANAAAPTVTIVANPTTVTSGGSSTLTVTANNSTQVVISDNLDTTTYHARRNRRDTSGHSDGHHHVHRDSDWRRRNGDRAGYSYGNRGWWLRPSRS